MAALSNLSAAQSPVPLLKLAKMPLRILATAAGATSVRYTLKPGQSRHFHRLPSGHQMEVIVHKRLSGSGLGPAHDLSSSDPHPNPNPPLVFVHGSFHAAWCWAERWMPFFSGHGYDCYAVSLLGQGESDIPTGSVAGSLEVTLSLAAKAFASSLPLCKETFFSSAMDDHLVQRYQELMKESSKLPLFDLKKLNASLPVPSIPKNSVELLVIGASEDFIVDKEGLHETAKFYDVQAVSVEEVAHDMMLDSSWEKGAETILSWFKSSIKQPITT